MSLSPCIYLQPHMHMRGKDMEMRFEYPTGESETMLNVPHYSYLWQTIYYEQEPLPGAEGNQGQGNRALG